MIRGGRVASVEAVGGGTKGVLTRSLLLAVREAERGRNEGRFELDTLPLDLPAGSRDSVRVSLRFGPVDETRPPDGLVLKFARQVRPALSVVGNTPPRYPQRLREMGVQGDVLVQFQITPQGTLREGTVRVLKSSDAAFSQAVLDVLPAYRFTPATLDCEPVFQLVQLPFAFLLGRRPLLAPDPPRR
jgi:TonB family protein